MGKEITPEELEVRFSYHAPKPRQPSRYELLRNLAWDFAQAVNDQCPDSREKNLALTRVEEAVMWANAAIARRE